MAPTKNDSQSLSAERQLVDSLASAVTVSLSFTGLHENKFFRSHLPKAAVFTPLALERIAVEMEAEISALRGQLGEVEKGWAERKTQADEAVAGLDAVRDSYAQAGVEARKTLAALNGMNRVLFVKTPGGLTEDVRKDIENIGEVMLKDDKSSAGGQFLKDVSSSIPKAFRDARVTDTLSAKRTQAHVLVPALVQILDELDARRDTLADEIETATKIIAEARGIEALVEQLAATESGPRRPRDASQRILTEWNEILEDRAKIPESFRTMHKEEVDIYFMMSEAEKKEFIEEIAEAVRNDFVRQIDAFDSGLTS